MAVKGEVWHAVVVGLFLYQGDEKEAILAPKMLFSILNNAHLNPKAVSRPVALGLLVPFLLNDKFE